MAETLFGGQPRPAPSRLVEIRLPDGRRVRATISPEPAQRRDIARLQRSHKELAKRITELEARADAATAGLLQELSDLKRRARELVPKQLAQGRQILEQMRDAKQLMLQTQIRGVTTVVNTMQATAYGDKGTLLSRNNLLLAASQLFWTLLDPVLQSTGALTGQGATIVAALSPLGTLLTGQVLVGDEQHVRFVSGESVVKLSNGRGTSSESLRGTVAEGFWPTFRDKPNAPVIVAVVDPPDLNAAFVRARVSQGVLELDVTATTRTDAAKLASDSVRVAWTVDTGAAVG